MALTWFSVVKSLGHFILAQFSRVFGGICQFFVIDIPRESGQGLAFEFAYEIGLSRVFVDYKFFKGWVFVRKIGHMEIPFGIPFDALPFLVLVFDLASPNSFVFFLDTVDMDHAVGTIFLDAKTVSVRFLERRFKCSFVSISPRANLKFFSIVRHGTSQSNILVDFGPSSFSDRRRHGGQSKEKDQKWPQHFSSFKNGPLPNISN